MTQGDVGPDFSLAERCTGLGAGFAGFGRKASGQMPLSATVCQRSELSFKRLASFRSGLLLLPEGA